MRAVILAGGRGTRLRPFTTLIPKPLVPIGDFAILEIVMHQLAQQGFVEATLAVGHLNHLIRSYIGDGSRWGLTVTYADEEEPLGTLGPVVALQDQLPDEFIVLNGDVLTDLNFADLLRTHQSNGAMLTVGTYSRDVFIDFGLLSSKGGEIVKFIEKPTVRYRVSMGTYAVSKAALRAYTPGEPIGFDRLIHDLIAAGTPPREYPFAGYWLDIGRPDDYDRANREFEAMRDQFLGKPKE